MASSPLLNTLLSSFNASYFPKNPFLSKTSFRGQTLTILFNQKPKPSHDFRKLSGSPVFYAELRPLDLTEDNVHRVLMDAKSELAQIFDTSVGITGEAELAELDGPFVKLSLKGRFWHKRSTVLARLGNYLKKRIPDEKDSFDFLNHVSI
ncbi:hypothetical protein AMTRI_Chr10g8430 [Amborella trichopoda]